jgi:hypothetical protein
VTKSQYVGPVHPSYRRRVISTVVSMATSIIRWRRGEYDIEPLFNKTPAAKPEMKIGGLGVRSDWNAESEFRHESGISPSSSGEGEPPSK